eukprot:XP_011682699.1 PREDICTED: double zinc ribbon and ankyrin repeat-containing protein 1 [Strongylocentrotus purpuratus]
MAAGAVVVPSIIPLRIPVQGKSKTDIDTNTYVELKSTTPDIDIFYTIDGTKPDPFQTIGQRTTFMYQRPFRLTEGRRTVKALAMARDQTRESFVVSKTFFVEWVREETDETDDEESLLEAEARNQSPGLKLTASKTTTALLKRVVEAETRRPDSIKGSNYRKPTVGTRFMENRMGTKKPSVSRGQKVGQGKKTPDLASEDDKKKTKKIPENFTQANRIQRQTDFLKGRAMSPLVHSTPDIDIFYTIDGTKPDPFQTIGQRTTFMYQRPFRLTEGRRTVKALAMARDQTRESFVVSKTFFVEWVREETDETDDDESLLEAEARNQSPGLKLTASKTTAALLKRVVESETRRPDSVKGSNYRKPTVGTRFMENRMGTKKPSISRGQKVGQGKKTPDLASEDDKKKTKKIPENFTQANRIQRQTDFLKCIFCFADRPADPFARFCISCGSPVPAIPNARLPPPEPAQLGMCVGCHSMIPLNVAKCLVCEMDVPPQLVPQASVKLQDKLVCNECGTGNPANMLYCVTCEHPLTGANRHLKPTYSQFAAPPEPGQKGRLLCCSKCGRVNSSDARYCDWCGAKPAPTTSLMTCSRCKAANQAYSSFCHSCGVLIEPPVRNDPRNNGITVGGKHTSQVVDQKGDSSWVPMTVPRKEPPKVSVSTMTAGIFYPSNKGLIKKELEQQEAKVKQDAMSDRKVTLTAVSPGKGYWRQQMDHVCGHLKAHAQNNTDFRNMIGEPRMGKLVTAAVHEDGYELSLMVCFALRGSKDAMTGKPLGITKSTLLSDVTEGRRNSTSSPGNSVQLWTYSVVLKDCNCSCSRGGGVEDRSEVSSCLVQKDGRRILQKKHDAGGCGPGIQRENSVRAYETCSLSWPSELVTAAVHEDGYELSLTPYDKDLLREVGPRGDGDEEEIQSLFEEGADPNSENADGLPVLTGAVVNKHFEIIPALIYQGADVNKKVGQKGNTALHEAVQLGYDGKKGVVTLLNNGASAKLKNNRDETPAAMATRLGNESIINVFTSTAGQGMLDRIKKQALGKTKTIGEDDF